MVESNKVHRFLVACECGCTSGTRRMVVPLLLLPPVINNAMHYAEGGQCWGARLGFVVGCGSVIGTVDISISNIVAPTMLCICK